MRWFGFEFSLSEEKGLSGFGTGIGIGENRKLSASRPAMSSHELITSGPERTGFGSGDGLEAVGPMVKRVGGVVGEGRFDDDDDGGGGGGGSRVRRP